MKVELNKETGALLLKLHKELSSGNPYIDKRLSRLVNCLLTRSVENLDDKYRETLSSQLATRTGRQKSLFSLIRQLDDAAFLAIENRLKRLESKPQKTAENVGKNEEN